MNIEVSHRSVSQLKTFSRCSEQYRLERVDVPDGMPPREAAWTVVGHAFHEAYEEWEETERRGSLAAIFRQHYDQGIAEAWLRQPNGNFWQHAPNVKSVENDIKLRGDYGVKCAETYEQHCRMADWTVEKIEWQFELNLGSVTVRGAVDSVLRWPDGAYTIRDIKTGNREEDNRQLGVYKLAVNKFLKLDVQWGEYWYTKDGENRAVDLHRYTTAYMTEQFEALDRGITLGNFIPSPGKICGLCSVKPYCREVGWINN